MTAPIELWRLGISELARWACGYSQISKDAPRYVAITEGRDAKQNRRWYSSCADLASFLAKRAGVRADWINRDDDDMFGPWERAKNVAKLAQATTPTRADYAPGIGDIWILSNTWPAGTDSHVCVCLGQNPDKPDEFLTANYGATGLQDVPFPGGKISSKPFIGGKYGAKKLVEVLEVPELVAQVTVKPDFEGPEFTAEWTGEVRDALEASAQ